MPSFPLLSRLRIQECYSHYYVDCNHYISLLDQEKMVIPILWHIYRIQRETQFSFLIGVAGGLTHQIRTSGAATTVLVPRPTIT